MATVTGLTAERMLEIENDSVVDGNVVGDDLILTTRGGTNINAGNVRGLQGIQGPIGEISQAQLDAAIASEVTNRNNAISSAPGWKHVSDGVFTDLSSFDIPITSSTYDMIRVHIRITNSIAGVQLRARINNDTSAIYHHQRHITDALDPETIYGVRVTSDNAWTIGHMSGTRGLTRLEIMDTNVNTQLTFQSTSTALATSSLTDTTGGVYGGTTTVAKLISSPRIIAGSGNFTGRYICEGYLI